MENHAPGHPPIVVIGGSAGAHEPLLRIVSHFPPDLAACVFVVIHLPTDAVSSLPHIIARNGHLFAAHALEGAPILPGRIIVAPPDFHLTVEGGVMHVRTGAKENGHRPSIDVLFRSAARSSGSGVLGVLLSGALDDGVDGLRDIKNSGGTTLVQDPDEAAFPNMPSAAIKAGVAGAVLTADEIAGRISTFTPRPQPATAGSLKEAAGAGPDEREEGSPSIFTCPDCGGTLWELEVQDDMRFRCRTGHAYSPASMLSLQSDGIEHGLWAAIRSLQERTDLLRKLALRADDRHDDRAAQRYNGRVSTTKIDIDALQEALNNIMSRPRVEV